MARTFHHFSPELKQRIVAELEAGQLTLREAAQDARTTINQVRVWLDEYGRYKPKRDIVEVVMRSEQERIAALEKALAEAHLTLQVYEELITQANTRFKTDIKKNFGTPRPTHSATAPAASTSPRSAAASGARATRTTNGSAAPALRASRRPT
jgi:transposase-like protein